MLHFPRNSFGEFIFRIGSAAGIYNKDDGGNIVVAILI
jgi:hypothetical protein